MKFPVKTKTKTVKRYADGGTVSNTADKGDLLYPQVSNSSAKGDRQYPQASNSSAKGDRQYPQTSNSSAKGDRQYPQASNSSAKGNNLNPLGVNRAAKTDFAGITPPKPKLRPSAPAAPKAAAKPVTKPASSSPSFKGNWTGAAATSMQKRGGARTNETAFQRMTRNSKGK